MPVTIPERPAVPRRKPPLWKRLGWFVLLYVSGVGVVAVVAYGIRLWIKP